MPTKFKCKQGVLGGNQSERQLRAAAAAINDGTAGVTKTPDNLDYFEEQIGKIDEDQLSMPFLSSRMQK